MANAAEAAYKPVAGLLSRQPGSLAAWHSVAVTERRGQAGWNRLKPPVLQPPKQQAQSCTTQLPNAHEKGPRHVV